MVSEEIISSISPQRFETYKRVFSEVVYNDDKCDIRHTILFYMEVQRLYSHFFIPIQVLEVTLRNNMHRAFSEYYQTESWFQKLVNEPFCSKNSKNMFTSTDVFITNHFSRKDMRHRILQPADYVGKLNFGFWVELLQANYRQTQFWQFHTEDVFPNKGKSKLGSIDDSLKRVKTIRNRLYHYEPQWKNQKIFLNLDDFCKNIEDKYLLIMKIVGFCSVGQKDLLEEYALDFEINIEGFKNTFTDLRDV
uniref:hypothetical protein n=1 Tax=Psychrobacter sp. TaxID=56811 RepID=UPI0015979068|nr:hypothetical protein [Psychrobacter sp.]QJS05786.1 hypothetical protein [Psychrobacter sp.]